MCVYVYIGMLVCVCEGGMFMRHYVIYKIPREQKGYAGSFQCLVSRGEISLGLASKRPGFKSAGRQMFETENN